MTLYYVEHKHFSSNTWVRGTQYFTDLGRAVLVAQNAGAGITRRVVDAAGNVIYTPTRITGK